jgi:hypothetical protein
MVISEYFTTPTVSTYTRAMRFTEKPIRKPEMIAVTRIPVPL